MADLNYTALMRWLESGDLNIPLHSGGVLDLVVYQFQVNVQRVVSLAIFPAIVVPDAMVSQLRRDAAALSLYGQLFTDSPDRDHAERNAAIEREAHRSASTFGSGILPPHPGLSEEMSGAESIEMFAGWDRHTAEGMKALMGAVILGMWTAFETLAADLWVECLNARPRLGFIALDADPSPEDDDATLDRKRNAKCPVPVWLFRDRSLDLNKSMGTILREQRRWDFGRRDRAADAYLKVFGRK